MARVHIATTRLLVFLGIISIFSACCGFSSYELFVFGDPELKNADIYIDGDLARTGVDSFARICLSYERHEIKVEQKGFKVFVSVVEPIKNQRNERPFLVKLEPLGSVPASPFQSDTAKAVK